MKWWCDHGLYGKLGGSITDMLPDRLLIQPSGDTYTRSGKHVRVGLYPYICPACGKRFEATPQHRYKTTHRLSNRDYQQVYCSYKCFRPVEKAAEDKFKADCFGFVAINGRDKPPIERARMRVEKCKLKMEEYRAIRNDPVKWNTLPQQKRWSSTSNYNEWKKKLAEAEEALELLEQMEREGI